MPGLAFEDDEEPGGHVTQHEEQLAQVGLQVTLGSMRQASSQLLMMAVKSSVRNLITPHLAFLPPSVSLESVDDSEKMLPVPIYLRCHVAVIPRMKLTPSSSFTLIRTSGDACILRHRPRGMMTLPILDDSFPLKQLCLEFQTFSGSAAAFCR